ncbi:MAG: sulfite exporter TauE/SafE family protein, partial [Rhodothermia bacterium]|nr:sulfite exporter TauE/SafE family protein [Rhodothermia bacterium]
IAEPVLTPLTLGTSLLCTLFTSSLSAFHHYRRGAVEWRIAALAGLGSILGVVTVTFLVTTKAWYDQDVFQVVFSIVLLAVAGRMFSAGDTVASAAHEDFHWERVAQAKSAVIGVAAGSVSSAVGVGGGVVLVPAFNRLLRLPIHSSVGTSSATIILISLVGVVAYAVSGLSAPSQSGSLSLGYVHPGTALVLGLPALLTTRLGVTTAHRVNRRTLQTGFAVFALCVAASLIYRAMGS